MGYMMDVLRRRLNEERHAEEMAREARIAEENTWFRPVGISIYTRQAVCFTLLSNPWNADGRWTGECLVRYKDAEKHWEIVSRAIEATVRKVVQRQREAGKVPSLIGWDCRLEHRSTWTDVQFMAPVVPKEG